MERKACSIRQTTAEQDFRDSEWAWFRCDTHGNDFVFTTYCDITRKARSPTACVELRTNEPQVDYP